MKIVLTLDYELFLGTQTGSVDKCLITPMKQLLSVADKYNIKFTIFADAAYIYKISLYSKEYTQLNKDYENISAHLKWLEHNGHDVQLHIHPHWYKSLYDGNQWILDHEHYKLSDIADDEATVMLRDSKFVLDNIIGKKTTAYRAGGFSAQPTKVLTKFFIENDITIDSSVYPRNYYKSPQQDFDYRKCPTRSIYRFDDDICKEDTYGRFTEIPLSVYNLSPIFYWRYVFTKLLKKHKHNVIGDGISVKTTNESIKERLFKNTCGFATIDGYKSSYLYDAYKAAKNNNNSAFCIIGHPKLATPYSIEKFKQFCGKVQNECDFVTISEYRVQV